MQEELRSKLGVYANLANHADIESHGLWDVVKSIDNIHCLCSIVVDPDTKEEVVLLFHDNPELDNAAVWDDVDEKEYIIPERVGTLLEGFRYWYRIGQSEKGKLYVHNSKGFDQPIVEKVIPKCKIPDHKWVDTFNQSKLQWFDRPAVKGAKSPHGLKAYGIKHGVNKPDITEWVTMDKYKLHRVVEDCKIQRQTSIFLYKEREQLMKLGIDMTECMAMEDEYTQTCHKQEVYGAKIDIDHVLKSIKYLDKTTEELAEFIEPRLPMTVKVSGGKVSRKEMTELFGLDSSRIKEQYEQVKKDGEMVSQPVKPYYKPTVNFHTIKKVNVYSGFNLSYGESPCFTKKKGLTDWIKLNHPDTKTKDWAIDKVVEETKLLNKNTCDYFEVNPEDTDVIAGAHTKIKFIPSKLTQHEVVKGMLIREGIRYAEEWNFKKDENNQIVKAEFDTEVRYPSKAAPEHQMVFPVKKGEALVTSPKFGEKEYDQLESEDGRKVGLYNTLVHRRRFLSNPKDPENKGILSGVREDGRIPCGVNNSSTGTLRSSHRLWVNAPSESAVFGEEIRKCIVADAGKKLVSHDIIVSL